MHIGARKFEAIWCVDFEFSAPPGGRPRPICLVARELGSGRTIRLFGSDLTDLRTPPYEIGPNSLFVAYYASAEMACHLALGWDLPEYVLDLYAEFRCLTNGTATVCGSGLLGALAHFGLPATAVDEKERMRQLAMRGGVYSDDERQALLAYCETDVDALAQLLPHFTGRLNEHALLRGRYMRAAAHIEHRGVPIDGEMLRGLRQYWRSIQTDLIAEIDVSYGVFEGQTFKAARFGAWLDRMGLPWPKLESGALDLSDDTFRDRAKAHPVVAPLRELRHSLAGMRLEDLHVGEDDRNRCLLSAFRSSSGRNQPSNTKFIFGPAVWLRGLIRPQPGCGLAYVDWSQQEFGIAAALSGDPTMMAAYSSGDPYLTFAKQAGAIPFGGTKKSHANVRELFKGCALAAQYGMGEDSLAVKLGKPVAEARELLRLHRATYPQFWRWSEATVSYAMLHGELWTVFDWKVRVEKQANSYRQPNARSLANFPMQANGAEMLRLACCLATERGIGVCAPVHDALLVEAPLVELDEVVRRTQAVMEEASAIVLGGFKLRSDAKLVRHPDRYQDERGIVMWDRVSRLVEHAQTQERDGR